MLTLVAENLLSLLCGNLNSRAPKGEARRLIVKIRFGNIKRCSDDPLLSNYPYLQDS